MEAAVEAREGVLHEALPWLVDLLFLGVLVPVRSLTSFFLEREPGGLRGDLAD